MCVCVCVCREREVVVCRMSGFWWLYGGIYMYSMWMYSRDGWIGPAWIGFEWIRFARAFVDARARTRGRRGIDDEGWERETTAR